MTGWIKLHRKLLKSRAWNSADAEGKVILITLLLRACHNVTKWQINTEKTAVLNPGELFISYRKFAKACGVSLKKLTVEFNRLTAVGFISTKSKKEGTIVRINNWEFYQLPDTPLDTQKETPLATPETLDTACDYTANQSSTETQKGTAEGTPLETHNKNIDILINKLNNTDKNKKLLSEVAVHPDMISAIAEYNAAFSLPKDRLDNETVYGLHTFAVTASPCWVLQAVRELKAANKEKVIRSPKNYLLGIITNWLEDGFPNDNKASADSLEEFYRQEGIA